VVIEDYISSAKCDQFREQITELVEENGPEHTYVERGDERFHDVGPDELNEPTVVKRASETSERHDTGMIDINHVDRGFPELNEIKHDDFIRYIVNQAAASTYKSATLHSYVNRSVTDTRGYHIDDLGEPNYKAVILSVRCSER
jgi:hypothetical protein